MNMEVEEKLQTLLSQYQHILNELERLESQKQTLREDITHLMVDSGRSFQSTLVSNEQFAIEIKEQTVVQYDESLLEQRLGKNYVLILKPDMKKIKKHLDDMFPLLAPHLQKIGSPSRELIRQQVTSGVLDKEIFQGTFTKQNKVTLYIKRRPS